LVDGVRYVFFRVGCRRRDLKVEAAVAGLGGGDGRGV